MPMRMPILATAALLTQFAAAQERPTHPFDRNWLIEHARTLAEAPHAVPEIDRNGPLAKLDYDRYRAIEFERGASIWNGEDRTFTVDLFHPGFLYRVPVNVNLVSGGVSRRVLYTSEVFNYGLDTAQVSEADAPGYSGFRVASTLNRPDKRDEFLVFQGASYFRAVGRDQRYGLSARGLSIATAKPRGEEFPVFTDFWIERPPEQAERIVIHALLQSQSATGAFTFRVAPGDSTTVDVDAVLFPRAELAAFGIAPLTSMFLFDSTNRTRFDDFRPAVHDSNGLSVSLANGERVWRPLANPEALQVSAFTAESPAGFGLIQRGRDFSRYEDSEARYELRPSLWIEPAGDWGRGHVELVEIPTDEEVYDNIVAFWQPAAPLQPGEAHEFSYRMYWGPGVPDLPDHGQVLATRAGAVGNDSDRRKFVIDFGRRRADRSHHVDRRDRKRNRARGRGIRQLSRVLRFRPGR